MHDDAAPGTPPDYEAMDALGRITNDRWEKINSGGTDVTFYDVELTYESSRNTIDYLEDNITAGFDVDYVHDGVERLTEAKEGTWTGSSISPGSRSQEWTLDPLGNWRHSLLDLNGDGDVLDAGELNEERAHNDVNELGSRNTDDAGAAEFTLSYDAVGNLIDDDENYEYEYDVFGRQTKVSNQSGTAIANYQYNGLGYLIREETVGSPSVWTENVYDGSWRVIAKYVDATPSDELLEEYVYHRAGTDGRGGSSYIDLVATRDRDTDDDGVLDELVYYCQDRMANVVVVLDDGASVLEWVGYSAYGVPFMSPPGDMDGDGTVTAGDLVTIGDRIDAGEDPVKADMHLDGDVTRADAGEIQTLYKDVAFGRGALSNVGNRVGFCGYRWAPVVGSGWGLRMRRVDAAGGRWLQRDTLVYTDGPSLYQYVSSRPLVLADPMGGAGTPVMIPMPSGGGEGPDETDVPQEEGWGSTNHYHVVMRELEEIHGRAEDVGGTYGDNGVNEDPIVNYMRHCVGICWLVKSRGSAFGSAVADAKEWMDMYMSGLRNPEDATNDMMANVLGVECGSKCRAISCEQCCRKQSKRRFFGASPLDRFGPGYNGAPSVEDGFAPKPGEGDGGLGGYLSD
jgi:RHS repeat-associated protein